MVKTIYWIAEAEKDNEKDRKTLCKLTSNAIYGKRMENLRHWIDVKNEKTI